MKTNRTLLLLAWPLVAGLALLHACARTELDSSEDLGSGGASTAGTSGGVAAGGAGGALAGDANIGSGGQSAQGEPRMKQPS